MDGKTTERTRLGLVEKALPLIRTTTDASTWTGVEVTSAPEQSTKHKLTCLAMVKLVLQESGMVASGHQVESSEDPRLQSSELPVPKDSSSLPNSGAWPSTAASPYADSVPAAGGGGGATIGSATMVAAEVLLAMIESCVESAGSA